MNVVINYTIHELTQYTRGKLHQYFPKIAEPTNLALDSRKILSPEDTVFFAMHSSHRNGYEFAKFVYEKGVRNFVIEKKSFEEGKLAGANVILVENSLTALHYLAIHHREDFRYLPSKLRLPLIGITGSNGKTIVKEWLNYILQNKYSVVRSPGSYNSQVGVPLSVLNLNPSHNLAIFEAGISSPGEMILLEKMIRPTIGIFTNIGLAHAAGFRNTIQKIQEKLKLFSRSSYLIYCSDDVVLDEEVRRFYKETVTHNKQFSLCNWGKSADNFLQISSLRKTKGMTAITAIFKGRKMAVTIPFIDDASVENAIHCWCTSLLLDVDTEETIQKFSTLYPIAMRLEIKEGNNHCTIINDSYSNDLHSLGIGLNFLAQQKQHNSRSIVLSDILQSGLKPQKLYADVSNLLQQGKVDKLIAIGPEIYKCQKEFSSIPSSLFFLSTDDFLKHSSPTIFQNESILVKGARSFGFEEIVSFLEKKVHKTVLSINLNALVHNLKEYKKLLHPNTK
ncbi:MAG: Mur ligase family protein, partial [Ginsengibacter sp.]